MKRFTFSLFSVLLFLSFAFSSTPPCANTNNQYITLNPDNYQASHTHGDLVRTDVHETSRAMDLQENAGVDMSDPTYKQNRKEYATSYGILGQDTLNYVLTSNGLPSLNSVNSNHVGSNLYKPNELTKNTVMASQEYQGLDLEQGSNRQLSNGEVAYIQMLSQDYANKKGISVEKAQRELLTAAMYNIDKSAHSKFDEGTTLLKATNAISEENIFNIQSRTDNIKNAYEYLLENSDGATFMDIYKETFDIQQMFTATQEQYKDSHWTPDNAIGLQDATLYILLPLIPKGVGSVVKGVGDDVAGRITINTGSKTENIGATNDFFAGTRYSEKVLGQTDKFHAFPESVESFQNAGKVTKITGGDGITREMLTIEGEYGSKKGFFEFIKEPDGLIKHRLFRPIKEQ